MHAASLYVISGAANYSRRVFVDFLVIKMRLFILLSFTCSAIVMACAHGPGVHHHHEYDGSYGSLMPTEKAVALFRSRIRDPRDYQNRSVLGRLLIRQARESGDLTLYREAENVLREALRSKPDHVATRFALAETLAARHDFRGAIELLQTLRKSHSESPQIVALLGDAYLNIGEVEKADQIYLELHRSSDSATVLSRLAHVDEIKGRMESAISRIKAAIDASEKRQDKKLDRVWYACRLGSIYWDQAKFKNALLSFERALEIIPDDPEASIGRAKSLAALGETHDAIAILREVVERTEHPTEMTLLAMLYRQIGKRTECRYWIERADQAFFDEAKQETAHYRDYANFLSNQGRDADRALDLARKELQRRPDLYSYDALAWAFFRCGKT